jgi:hypothetical protein
MRFRRECSKPSRQFWENVIRDSSGGCVLPMGRPSKDCSLPSAGDKDATVTYNPRTAIVPQSQYLRKSAASHDSSPRHAPARSTCIAAGTPLNTGALIDRHTNAMSGRRPCSTSEHKHW